MGDGQHGYRTKGIVILNFENIGCVWRWRIKHGGHGTLQECGAIRVPPHLLANIGKHIKEGIPRMNAV